MIRAYGSPAVRKASRSSSTPEPALRPSEPDEDALGHVDPDDVLAAEERGRQSSRRPSARDVPNALIDRMTICWELVSRQI